MPDRNNFFYVDEKGEEVKETFREETQIAKLSEIKKDILYTVRKGLSFLKDWHLCPNCNVVFGLREGEEGICPNCESRFVNERGDLIFKGFAGEEEIEEEEEEKEKDEEFEPVVIRGGSLMSPENEEVDIKRIGTEDCPYCEKSVDWDKIEPHYGFFGVVKKCPECGGQSYMLNEDDKIWLRRNVDRDNEIGLFGGISFGGEEEED
ncbi:hypothetical protein ES703_89069 [subsurface metagenome]